MIDLSQPLYCLLNGDIEAGIRACPCYNCIIVTRGIKDILDIEDLEDAHRRQRRSRLRSSSPLSP
jgi:hypothetical protein